MRTPLTDFPSLSQKLTVTVDVYYLCFPSDYWWIKFSGASELPCIPYTELGAAYGLYLLELGQTVLVTKLAWADLCAGWGIKSTLLHIDWGFWMTPIANGLSKQYTVLADRHPDVIYLSLTSMLQLPSVYKHTSPGEYRL